MSESLTRRVGRLVAGSFNSIIDAVENAAPESVMEQAIREIDDAISEVRRDLGSVEAQRHLTARRLSEDSTRHEQLGEQAHHAVREGREDLAAVAIERQMDLEAQIPILESRMSELAEDKSRLEGFINALQAKKREMRGALDEYRRSQKAAQSAGSAAEAAAGGGSGSTERAERAGDAFDRVFRRQTGLSGVSGTSAEDAARLAELEELSRQNRIQERLARLKAGSS